MVMAIQPGISTTSTDQKPLRGFRGPSKASIGSTDADPKPGDVRKKSLDSEPAGFASMLIAILTSPSVIVDAATDAGDSAASMETAPSVATTPPGNQTAESMSRLSSLSTMIGPEFLRSALVDPEATNSLNIAAAVQATAAQTSAVPGTSVPGTLATATVTTGTVTPGTLTSGTVTSGTVTSGTVTPGTVTSDAVIHVAAIPAAAVVASDTVPTLGFPAVPVQTTGASTSGPVASSAGTLVPGTAEFRNVESGIGVPTSAGLATPVTGADRPTSQVSAAPLPASLVLTIPVVSESAASSAASLQFVLPLRVADSSIPESKFQQPAVLPVASATSRPESPAKASRFESLTSQIIQKTADGSAAETNVGESTTTTLPGQPPYRVMSRLKEVSATAVPATLIPQLVKSTPTDAAASTANSEIEPMSPSMLDALDRVGRISPQPSSIPNLVSHAVTSLEETLAASTSSVVQTTPAIASISVDTADIFISANQPQDVRGNTTVARFSSIAGRRPNAASAELANLIATDPSSATSSSIPTSQLAPQSVAHWQSDSMNSMPSDMRPPLSAQVTRAVMEHIERQGLRQNDSLTVRLDPPELGEMTIQLSKTHEGIAVRVTAREAVTMDMLFARGQEIESHLRGQQLNLKSLEFLQAGMSGKGYSEGQQQNDGSRESENLLTLTRRGSRVVSSGDIRHGRTLVPESAHGLSFRA